MDTQSATPEQIQQLREKAARLRRTVNEGRACLVREEIAIAKFKALLAGTERELARIEARLQGVGR